MKHLWLSVVLMFGICGALQAQPPYGYGPGAYRAAPRENPATEAVAVLREGMDKLLAFVGQEERPNKLQVAAFLDKEIAPFFDFDHMAKWVAGRRHADMDEQRREALVAKLEERFLSTLSAGLAKYEGQRVRYLRPRPLRGGAVSARVGILRPGGYPSKLDFRMYRSADGWKVYDVIANGRSSSAYYRQQFKRAAASRPPAASSR